MQKVTERQQEVLDFLAAFQAEKSFSPTVREISQHFGIRLHAVSCHLNALRHKGLITWVANAARTIRLLDKIPAADTSSSGNSR